MEEDAVLLEIQGVENADFKVDVSIIKKRKRLESFNRNIKVKVFLIKKVLHFYFFLINKFITNYFYKK